MFDPLNYSPTEMLQLCKAQSYEASHPEKVVLKILAEVATQRDREKLIENLSGIIESVGSVSIGRSLDRLFDISRLGNELQGDHDGLDALCYHLSADACEKGIKALRAVLDRFEEDRRNTNVIKRAE